MTATANIIADANYQARAAQNIASRARLNLFAAIDRIPEAGGWTWEQRAIADQHLSASESMKARVMMDLARKAITSAA